MLSSVSLAKAIMRKGQVTPTFDKRTVGELNEIFNHPTFVNGSEIERREIMLKSSESKYRNEFEFPFDRYFGFDLRPRLENKSILDLGCFTGGRSAAWFEQYRLKHVAGMDISEIFIEASRIYAQQKGISADFRLGFGESIPFPDGSFDAVLTYDVLEHVRDVEATLRECHRVLKPDGRLFLVFPTYYQPVEHHLGLVTRTPGLQFIFSGKTLVRAYYEILAERGPDAEWYRRDSPELKDYEKGHTVNGTSFRMFSSFIKGGRWETEFVCRKPIGSVGRSVERRRWIKAVSFLFAPLTHVPFLQEIFLHRVTMILRRLP